VAEVAGSSPRMLEQEDDLSSAIGALRRQAEQWRGRRELRTAAERQGAATAKGSFRQPAGELDLSAPGGPTSSANGEATAGRRGCETSSGA
jgi:hypothetical protein